MRKDMTSGSPMRSILLFSGPVLLGNLFQQLYNMADTVIVGKCVGNEALGAVGATGCLMFLVLGFAGGIAQGFGVMISQVYGAKDFKRLRHYVALSLILTVLVSILLTVPTVLGCDWLLQIMNTPIEVYDYAKEYIQVIFRGILMTMLYNVTASILRGIGDSKTPLYFLLLSSFLNIALDLFFILVLHGKTAGAAWATVISQGVSALLCLIYMFSKFEILRVHKEDFYFDFQGVFRMLSIGIPMALNYSITAMGTIILQSAVNAVGPVAVTAFAAASKVVNLSTQTLPTLGAAIATYCGQNLGAGKYDRIFKGVRSCFWLCFITAGLAAFICCVFGRPLVSLFLNEPTEEIFDYAMKYLYVSSAFMIPLAWIFVYRNALQALNQGLIPMLSGVVELVSRYIVILFAAVPFGYFGVCFADASAWLTTGLLLIVTYIIWELRMRKRIHIREKTR